MNFFSRLFKKKTSTAMVVGQPVDMPVAVVTALAQLRDANVEVEALYFGQAYIPGGPGQPMLSLLVMPRFVRGMSEAHKSRFSEAVREALQALTPNDRDVVITEATSMGTPSGMREVTDILARR